MKRIHIVGYKNHGKTTFVVELTHELRKRNLRVGTIKHTNHPYELDKPGSDSHQHRAAGAQPAAIIAGNNLAIHTTADADPYQQLESLYQHCDIVLVEGDKSTPLTPPTLPTLPTPNTIKIEIHRTHTTTTEPLIAQLQNDITAIITDQPDQLPPDINIPVWPRHDIAAIAQHIINVMTL